MLDLSHTSALPEAISDGHDVRSYPDDAVPPSVRLAVEGARQRELAGRLRGSKGACRIVERPPGRYGTWRVRSKESGNTYEVLWPKDGVMACSCPDARTSELSHCKHFAYVESKAPKRGASVEHCVVILRPSQTLGRSVSRLGEIQVYVPDGRFPAIRRLLDADGRVLSGTGTAELYDALCRTRQLQWGDGVAHFLVAALKNDAWTGRFARFEKRVRAHLDHGRNAPPPWARMQLSLACHLRPYQVEGVLFAARQPRALLADDMGLGKTLQAIATLVLLREVGEPTRTLVVCPSSVKSQWKAEIDKFAPGLRAVVVEGTRAKRRSIIRRNDADVYIMNFATLRNDLGEVGALKPDVLVVDEAQRIKNWNTKTAKSLKAVRCPRVLALTGTPLENRLAELHSVMELLDSRALGPLWRLMPEHAMLSDDDGRISGVRGLDLLRRRMGQRWLRRTKRDVLSELPERHDETKLCDWTEAQQSAHAQHMQSCARILHKKHMTQEDFVRLMAEMQSMRIISNGLAPYLYDELAPELEKLSDAQLLRRYPSPKLELARDVLSDLIESGEKVVVFSQWRRTLSLTHRLIRPALRAQGAHAIHFHGGLRSAQRTRVVEAFHNDPGARVLFATDAGGVGLNLQQAASTVVHLEAPWNPAVFEQRVGRVHRMGQKQNVRVISLRSDGGIEPRVAAGMVNKQALFDGLFEGADTLTFGQRESFVERMKSVVGVEHLHPPSSRLVQVEGPIDAPTCQVPVGVPMNLCDEPALTVDGRFVRGPETALSLEAEVSGFAKDTVVEDTKHGQAFNLPGGASLRAQREGDAVKIEIDGLGETSWTHLRAFLESLAGTEARD